MDGTADARFYGTSEYGAQEFGGTFALASATSYYYGAFGAANVGGSVTPPPPDPNPNDMVSDISLSDASSDGLSLTNGELQAIGVQAETTNSVLNFNDADTSLSLTFDADGKMNSASFNLNNVNYAADIATYPQYSQTSDIRIYGDLSLDSVIQDSSNFWVSRGFNDSFEDVDSFESEYMVSVIWEKYSDENTSQHGYLVAGFETAGADIPTDSGTVRFKGNGEGRYLGSTESYGVDFDAEADIDFSARTVTFSTSKTHYINYEYDSATDTETTTTVLLGELNIENAVLSYASGTNIIRNANAVGLTVDGTILTATAGDIQARFYGTGDNAAQEFGGTFNFINGNDNSEYYYGFFGAARAATGGDDGGGDDGGGNPFIPAINYASYGSFDDVSTYVVQNETAQTVHLPGVAVLVDNTTTYSRSDASIDWTDDDFESSTGDISRITAPVISLTFDTHDDYGATESYISAATLYVGNKKYTATVLADEEYKSNSSLYKEIDGISDGRKNISINTGFYSNKNYFVANYMKNIDWDVGENLSETAKTDTYSVDDGYMVAGFETAGGAINSSGNAEFKGVGEGNYVTTAGVYYPDFNITADVDFSARSVKLITTDTGYCDYDADYNCTFQPLNQLNFTSTLTYDLGNNSISGAVTADGMNGTADARFYGTGDNVAEELGGTFYMNNGASNYYYGYFGATTEGVKFHNLITVANFDDIQTTSVVATDYQGQTSFAEASTYADNNGAITFTLPSIASVSIPGGEYTGTPDDDDYYSNIFSRTFTLAKVLDSSLALTFDGDGDISAATINAGTLSETLSDSGSSTYFYAYENDPSKNISVSANFSNDNSNSNQATFDAAYMVRVEANYTINDYEAGDIEYQQDYYEIYMIAGFETVGGTGGNIPTTGTAVTFNGSGEGYYNYDYGNIGGGTNVDFDVTAVVDFENYDVTLTTSNTGDEYYTCDENNNCGNVFNSYDHLNFTGTLNYAAGMNAIAGNVETAGDVGNNIAKLTGTADARFYGSAAQEFGGTFSMNDGTADNYYYGYFGAQRQSYIISSETLTTTHADTPTSFNANNLTSFDDEDRKSTTNNALQINNLVQITKNNVDRTIINNKITGAVAEFDYDSGGAFKDDGFRFYLTDKKYSITGGDGVDDGYNTQDYIFDWSPDSSDADTPSYIRLTKESIFFGFTANYMILVNLELDESDYDSLGYGITGFETTSIPSTGTAVTFTGKGRGTYYDTSSGFNTSFDVTATANFVNRRVNLASTNTCTNSNDCENTLLPHLNFTGTLQYLLSPGQPITYIGSGRTKGDTDNNISSLVGAVDARFYGPAVEEFGGTFSLNNADAGYVGYFGAFRYGIVKSIMLDVTAITTESDNLHTLTPRELPTRYLASANLYQAFDHALMDVNYLKKTTSSIDGVFQDITQPDINHTINYNQGNADIGQTRNFIMNAIAISKIDAANRTRAPNWDWSTADSDKNIALSRIINSSVQVRLKDTGEMMDLNVDLDATTSYAATNATPNITGFTSDITTNLGYTDGTETQTMTLTRDKSFFGFAAGNMLYISWYVFEDGPALGTDATGLEERQGMMIAGIETRFTDIYNVTKNATFTGKGRGVYENDSNENYQTIFDIKADIVFNAKTITINSENTCKDVVNADCTGADRLAELDFSTDNITYTSKTIKHVAGKSYTGDNKVANNDFVDTVTDFISNQITGAVNTGSGTGDLSGTLDARFYGSQAHELGGTFAMSNGNTYYYGAFGGLRNGILIFDSYSINTATSSVLTPNVVNIPVAYNSLTAATLDRDNSNKTFTMNALAFDVTYNKFTYGRSAISQDWNANGDYVQTATEHKFINTPTASIIFDDKGEVTRVVAQLNVGSGTFEYSNYNEMVSAIELLIDPNAASKQNNPFTHSADKSVSTADIINDFDDFAYVSDTDLATITVDRGLESFGFYPHHMAFINWRLETVRATDGEDVLRGNSSINDGFIVTGITTFDADLTALTSAVKFRGKGRGIFERDGGIYYHTRFDVTADIDFGTAKTVKLYATNTCKDVANADCAGADRVSDLDFTVGDGAFNKAVKLDVNNKIVDNSQTFNVGTPALGGIMNGKITANFYGAGGSELAGYFNASSPNNFYFGVFGLNNGTHTSQFGDAIATNHANTPAISNPLPADFDTAFASATDISYNLPALTGVTRDYNENAGTTSLKRYDAPVIKVTFDSAKPNQLKDVTLYVGADEYVGNNTAIGTEVAKEISNSITAFSDGTSLLHVASNATKFGFATKYMALIHWELDKTDNSSLVHGYGLAGIKTVGIGGVAGIPNPASSAETIVKFTGKGAGHIQDYDSDNNKYNAPEAVTFVINADVNFYRRTAIFNGDVDGDGNEIWDFNTPTLHYIAADNHIIGDVSANGDGATGVRGTIEASFYGPQAAELGGTIIMESLDGEKNFIGAFGAAKQP
ncbi:MAG: transferrin-binding protein-like solute binding protein [Alphaproteobacteria bacterium]|nr:transferrin-binding protein-like solute binding protein [Alphaproteobacteria bacterium]